MINWYIDKVSDLGDWIGKEKRRVHVLMALADFAGLAVVWVFISATVTALSVSDAQGELLTILRGKSTWALAGLCIPLGHYALTSWGENWIKRSAKSFSVTFLTVAVGGALLGIVITDYVRTHAITAGYRSCDQTFLNDFQRENETLVASGVLCPSTSSAGKPYPPPIVMHQLN
ncbi:hypothetical protein, partial [Pseudovibrio sp. WM33]|uniref:hypothetical protein n=1 Tax=Pseudovibrio sp. WM33 TaxID=1735585 RepID=UPI000A3ED9A3